MSTQPRSTSPWNNHVPEEIARLLVARTPDRVESFWNWSPKRYRDAFSSIDGTGPSGETVGPPVPPTEELIRQIEAALELHERDNY